MDEIAPVITLVVHPIDVEAHPSWGPGWRWAVHVGRPNPADVTQCANAGWCPDMPAAMASGDACAATAVQAARAFGIPVRYGRMELQYDPIPAGEERTTTL